MYWVDLDIFFLFFTGWQSTFQRIVARWWTSVLWQIPIPLMPWSGLNLYSKWIYMCDSIQACTSTANRAWGAYARSTMLLSFVFFLMLQRQILYTERPFGRSLWGVKIQKSLTKWRKYLKSYEVEQIKTLSTWKRSKWKNLKFFRL